jgi:hypothetical protein
VNRRQLIQNKALKECNKEILLGKQWRNTELPEVRKKRVHKQKKKVFIERGLEESEHLRSNSESRSFYRKLNRSRKGFQPRTILCPDKEGMLLSEEDDILRRWAEHFDELLNIVFSNQNVTNKEIYQAYLDTDEPTPTLDEVDNTIQKLKDNKAPGMDLIPAELIKKGRPDLCMYHLITKIWVTETIPEDWN